MESIARYQQLIEKVEGFCSGITARFTEHIACRRGCDACCTHIGVMPLEGVALAIRLTQLPLPEAERIRARARMATLEGGCPLLQDGECLLYSARPLICRTHGLPILIEEETGRRIDHCPLNFQQMESLPGDAVLNLETLNTTLAAINALFLNELGEAAVDFPERISIADALLLELT